MNEREKGFDMIFNKLISLFWKAIQVPYVCAF